MTDEKYMNMALKLAEKGEGRVSPNPLVGCIIVKNGNIVSEGYHEMYGGYHAERNALNKVLDTDAYGADLYVNLEPCCHYGKTPPCTDIIIEKNIKRVIIGCIDDNPKVGGKGIKILRDNGIEVVTGVLEEKCRKLNEIFFHCINKKSPFFAVKYAMTADGKIASYTGHSKWITGEKARGFVHRLRNRYKAIMIGINTALIDNPMLTCRIDKGVNPIRIICDSKLNIDEDSNIVKTAKDVKTYVACCEGYDLFKAERLEKRGINILIAGEKGKNVDMNVLSSLLWEEGIDSVLIEGGGEINFSVFNSKIVNKAYVFVAPKILGGRDAKTPVEGIGIADAKESFKLKLESTEILGEDILLEYGF